MTYTPEQETYLEKLVFVDTETTGLDPDRHKIWDVAWITREFGKWVERQYFLEHHDNIEQNTVEVGADLIALNIGKFFNRYPHSFALAKDTKKNWTSTSLFAEKFREQTIGKHLVGAVPSFDEERLRKLLLKHNITPAWHYHLICVETLLVGYLQGKNIGDSPKLPWKSQELYESLGVVQPEEEQHTALGDARLCKNIFLKVMGIPDET